MNRRKTLILSLIISAFSSLPAIALESDANEEITIQSNRAEFDRKVGTAIYIGDVVLEQGTLKITADRVTLYSNEQKKLTKAIAVGEPAQFEQLMDDEKGLTEAEGKTITYRTLDKNVTLLDDAVLEQEGHVFTGETIVYNMIDETVSAKGSTQTELDPEGEQKPTRIKMIIQPESDEPTNAQQTNTDKVVPSENP